MKSPRQWDWFGAQAADDGAAIDLARVSQECMVSDGYARQVVPTGVQALRPVEICRHLRAFRKSSDHWTDLQYRAEVHALQAVIPTATRVRDAVYQAARSAAQRHGFSWDMAITVGQLAAWDAGLDAGHDVLCRAGAPGSAAFQPLVGLWRMGYVPLGVSRGAWLVARLVP